MMKLFNGTNGTKPVVADVEAARAQLEQERQDVRARQQAIENAIADAYGTDTDTSALEADYAALQARLAALAIVERRLQAEHVEAAKREALAQYQAAVESIAADWAALHTIQPKREKAARAYFDLLADENRIRERLRLAAMGERQAALRQALAAVGLDPADLGGDVEALDASISDATGAIVRFVHVDGSYK